MILAATGDVQAQSSAELAALRAELQQLRSELDRTRAMLAEAQRDIAELTSSTNNPQALRQWRDGRLEHEAEQRALTRERLRVDRAREALRRTAAAESRKVEALQSTATVEPVDRLPARSTDRALGYGYTQQYGWPYNYSGTYIGSPGSYFSTGVYRPYWYVPYRWHRPYYYRPHVYRSGFRFGYHGDHFRFDVRSGARHRHHERDAVKSPKTDPAPMKRKLKTTPRNPGVTRPHPAFQLRLRDE